MKCSRRMIHGDHRPAADPLRPAMDGGDASVGDEARHREAPKSDNDFRIDGPNLTFQVTRAGFNLLGLRVAVARRAAFDDIRDIDLIPLHLDRGQQLLQEAARRADKRPALLVLVKTRPLSDKHQFGVRRSLAGHRKFARGVQFAIGAHHNLIGYRLQFQLRIHGSPPSLRLCSVISRPSSPLSR